ncbi:hypothetical protein OHS18_46570 [Amycolatopsis sp. NBC_00355]|uniref:hypothetical protein n=1 Tax=Amycolatopsis sp. NBC_00355 TaxID=2975957 RepID=UPI002E25BB4D
MENERSGAVGLRRVFRAGILAAVGIGLSLGLTACNGKLGSESGTAVPVSPAQGQVAASVPSATSESASIPSGGHTAGLAVVKWVTQVLNEDYAKACRSSAAVAPPEAGDPAKMCASDGDAVTAMKQLHDSWAKPGIPLPPEVNVEVDDVAVQGDSASVSDTSIKIGDKTLRDLELIGSSGDTSSFTLTLRVKKKEDVWYVGDMNIHI